MVAVTMGDPRGAKALCDRMNVPFPCLADADRAGYKAFGLRRGTGMEVMGPANWAAGMRAAAKGHLPSAPVGDPMQLPGTFIIDRDGIVQYARYARHASDHPEVSELVRALRGLQGAG